MTGKAAAAPDRSRRRSCPRIKGYAAYVPRQVNQLIAASKTLDAAIEPGNVTEAQEGVREGAALLRAVRVRRRRLRAAGLRGDDNAGNLDYLIDMRDSNLDAKVGWHGFHAIERDLFQGRADHRRDQGVGRRAASATWASSSTS